MRWIVAVLFVVVGLVNFAPVIGVSSAGRVRAMYDVAVDTPSLEILLRHRAVLFGVVGSILLVAAWVPSVRNMAIAVGFVSMLSFVLIAWGVGSVSPALRRVVVADVVGLVLLAVAGVLHWTVGR